MAAQPGSPSTIQALADEWDELADRLDAPPQTRPGWFLAWAEAFAAGEIEVLSVRRDGKLAGVLPLERRRRAWRAPANYHSPGFGELSESADVTAELCEAAVARAGRRLALALVDSGGPLAAGAHAAAEAAGRNVIARETQRTPVVRTDGAWEDYLGSLGRGFRKELRRRRRRLEELGTLTFEMTDGCDDLERRLAEIFAVETTGWKAERGTGILSRPETKAFYEQIGRWAADRGVLRLFVLRLDGKPVAVDYALESGGVRYLLKGGFDPEYSRIGPGGLLLEDGLRHAFEFGLSRVELGGGDDPYKLRWTEDVRARSLVLAFRRSPLGLADYALEAFGRPLAARARRRRRG